mmetsp:Transcript_27231/g.68449  ORF Transcript_27231/g.68449 Transcript_27231/m.68449 type:complete len:267 (-) Transcript_27231:102-902(-)
MAHQNGGGHVLRRNDGLLIPQRHVCTHPDDGCQFLGAASSHHGHGPTLREAGNDDFIRRNACRCLLPDQALHIAPALLDALRVLHAVYFVETGDVIPSCHNHPHVERDRPHWSGGENEFGARHRKHLTHARPAGSCVTKSMQDDDSGFVLALGLKDGRLRVGQGRHGRGCAVPLPGRLWRVGAGTWFAQAPAETRRLTACRPHSRRRNGLRDLGTAGVEAALQVGDTTRTSEKSRLAHLAPRVSSLFPRLRHVRIFDSLRRTALDT